MSMHLNLEPIQPPRKTRNLFCSADRVGIQTGGGVVCKYEYYALQKMSDRIELLDDATINPGLFRYPNSPFVQDYLADAHVLQMLGEKIDLAHFYSGAFGKTIWRLRNAGTTVTQTIAAHDIQLSMEEFQKYGIPFDFPHLTNRTLWLPYVEGQLMAELVICPSRASEAIVRRYGVVNTAVIPHGCYPATSELPAPTEFNVGYLGQCGPDKGLRYLLEAWSKLNLKGCRLIMAGRGIEQMAEVWKMVGGKGEVEFIGEVKDPADLFARIAWYVQPSVTEGFGIPVLEAMAHRRPCIVSDGAGAADMIENEANGYVFPKRDVDALCELLKKAHKSLVDGNETINLWDFMSEKAYETATAHTWDKIVPRYQEVWKHLLGISNE